jgi:hypothetical protein
MLIAWNKKGLVWDKLEALVPGEIATKGMWGVISLWQRPERSSLFVSFGNIDAELQSFISSVASWLEVAEPIFIVALGVMGNGA